MTGINDNAFAGYEIERVVLPEGLTWIGKEAFYNCWELTSVILPEGLLSIGDYAFASTNLTELNLPEGLLSIGDHAFASTNLTELNLPEGLVSIGDEAFVFCSGLTEVSLPDSLSSLGTRAFFYCENLADVTLSPGLSSVGEEAFAWCYSIANLTIPEGVTILGDSMFSGNPLTDVTLPASLTAIGKGTFDSCWQLTNINLPEGMIALGDEAFSRCRNLKELRLPDSLEDVGSNPFVGTPVDILISPDHPRLELVNGALFDKEEKRLISYPYTSTKKEYILPEGTLAVGDRAFISADSLTKVTLPKGLESIGHEAFAACRELKSLALPDSLTVIVGNPFSGTDIKLKISDKHPVFEVVKDVLFNKLEKTLIYCPGIKKGVYTVPDGTRCIGDFGFWFCGSLSVIQLPESLTHIGDNAFYYCSGLTELLLPKSLISIDGTKDTFGTYQFIDQSYQSRWAPIPLKVYQDSYAQEWLESQGISEYTIIE